MNRVYHFILLFVGAAILETGCQRQDRLCELSVEIATVEVFSYYLNDTSEMQRASSNEAARSGWLYAGPAVRAEMKLTNRTGERAVVFADELLGILLDGVWADAQGRQWAFRRERAGKTASTGAEPEVVVEPMSRKSAVAALHGTCFPRAEKLDDSKPVEEQVSYPAKLQYSVDTLLRGPSKVHREVRVIGAGVAAVRR